MTNISPEELFLLFKEKNDLLLLIHTSYTLYQNRIVSSFFLQISENEILTEDIILSRIEPYYYGRPLFDLREDYIVIVYDDCDGSAERLFDYLRSDDKTKTLHKLEGGFQSFFKKYKRLSYSGASASGATKKSEDKIDQKCVVPSEILDGFLWLGNKKNAHDLNMLKNNNIKYILNCTHDCENMFPNNFEYYQIRVEDTNSIDLMDYFDEACYFIEKVKEENSSILVHCHEGISRGPSFVISYLISSGWSLYDAFWHIKKKRPIILPNRIFFWSLVRYEKKKRGVTSFSLKKYYSLYGLDEVDMVPFVIQKFYNKT